MPIVATYISCILILVSAKSKVIVTDAATLSVTPCASILSAYLDSGTYTLKDSVDYSEKVLSLL